MQNGGAERVVVFVVFEVVVIIGSFISGGLFGIRSFSGRLGSFIFSESF